MKACLRKFPYFLLVSVLLLLMLLPGRAYADFGNALRFTGGNATYVRAAALDLRAGSGLTLEAWILTTNITTTGYSEIIRQQNTGNPDWLLAFQNNGANLTFGLSTDTTYDELRVAINPADYADGNWHHIAAVYDGGTKSVYKDGVLIGSGAQSGVVRYNGGNFGVAATLDAALPPSEFFTGQIDEVRVWNMARSSSDITSSLHVPLQGNESGLAAYWPFDEGTGTTTRDASSHGQTATLYNHPVWVVSTVPFSGPSALTTAATGVSSNSGTLNGLVNPRGMDTTYYFEYGPSTAYGTQTGTFSAGNGTSALAVSNQLANLSAGTTYHFRVVAMNADGTTRGNDLSFSTTGPVGGMALSFDGQSSWVSTPGVNLSAGNAATFEAWIQPNDLTSHVYSDVLRQNAGNPDWLLGFQNSGTTLVFGLGTTSGYQELHIPISPGDLADGRWHHIAAVYDGTTKTVYVDGSAIGSAAQSGNINFFGSTDAIGASGSAGLPEFFNGSMDELRIWSTALTPAQIIGSMFTTLTGRETGLAGYYQFDDGSGNLATDSSTNAATGLLVNNPAWVASTVPTAAIPGVVTGSPTQVGSNNATLTGKINPLSVSSSAYFEYGTTLNYDHQTPLQSAGNGVVPLTISNAITGLNPGAVYHCRLVGYDPNGTNFGKDMAFSLTGPVGGEALGFDGSSSYAGTAAVNMNGTNALTLEAWIKPANLTATASSVILQQDAPGISPDWLLAFQNNGTVLAFGLKTGVGYQEYHLAINPAAYVDGHWHHLAATYDGTRKRLYRDGIQIGSAAQTGNVTYTGSGNGIGAALNPAPTNFFNGSMDEVRIWSTGRSLAEINNTILTTLTGTEAGLAAYYGFDEGSGATTADLIGNNHPATLFNNPAWIVSTVPATLPPAVATGPALSVTANSAALTGTAITRPQTAAIYFNYGFTTNYGARTATQNLSSSNALVISNLVSGLNPAQGYHYQLVVSNSAGASFGADKVFFTLGTAGGLAAGLNGSNAYVRTAPLNLSNGNTLTIEAWIKPNDIITTGFSEIIRQQGGSTPDWLISFQNNGNLLSFGVRNIGGNYLELQVPITPTDLMDGNWHHVAGIYDGANKYLYLDGTQIGTQAQTGNVAFTGVNNGIGANLNSVGTASEFFNGMIDELRIWSVARSGAQINQKLDSALTGAETGLAGYWRFDEGSGTVTYDLSVNGHNATLNNAAWTNSSVPLPPYIRTATGAATSTGLTSAGLTATANPGALATSGYFQYGTTTNYDSQTALQNLGSGSADLSLSNFVPNLQAGQGYHFRSVANNSSSAAFGRDRNFFTTGPLAGTALDLNGTNQYASHAAINLSSNAAMSLEVWIRPNDMSARSNVTILRQQSNNNAVDWLLGFENNGTVLAFGLTAGGLYQELKVPINPIDYADGNWHHLAATYDGAVKRLYRDGALIGTNTQTGKVNYFGTLGTMGVSQTTGANLTNHFSGSIDEVRIWRITRTGVDINQGLNIRLTGAETGLAGYWRFDEGTGAVSADASGNGVNASIFNSPAWISSGAAIGPPRATLSGFSPAQGAMGTSVVITGTNLLLVTNVLFNGTSASFSTNSNNSLTATVPAGATTGPITINGPFTSAVSTNSFLVDNTPPSGVISTPANASFIAGLSALRGTASDNAGGSGLGSVVYYIQRESDLNFWTGSGWAAPTPLAATLANGVWAVTNGLPPAVNLNDGAYTIYLEAIDNVGNNFLTNIGVTVNKAGAITPVNRLTNGHIQVRFAGIPGRTYRIQASTDLLNWVDIGTVTQDSSGILQFEDNGSPGFARRFYRTVTP